MPAGRHRTRHRPGARLCAVLVATGLALLTGACTSGPSGPTAGPTATTLPEGVSVRVYQTRFDYAERVLEVSVSNAGPATLELRGVSFDSPHFASAATEEERLELEPGLTRDLRLHLAEPVCHGAGATDGDGDGAPDRTVTGTVTLSWAVAGNTGPGGATTSATVPAVDDTGALDRITSEDCLRQAVDSVLTITQAPVLRVEGVGGASVAWIDLTFTPTGTAGTVTIDQVGSTVLLTAATARGWPVATTLDASSPPLTVSIDLRPSRCDPHAVAEDKRGTVFPLSVTTSAGPAGDYDLPASDTLRAQLYAWIADHCAY